MQQAWSAPMQDNSKSHSDMFAISINIAEIDKRIAALRENLRNLVEQSAAYSGAADEELTSGRIAEQEAELQRLTKQRDELSSRYPRRNLRRPGGQSGQELE
jgi:predicted  nucleic acid-binding Zn-ribbon protein